LRRHRRTESRCRHKPIPVIAFAAEGATEAMDGAQRAGAKLVVSETTIADYLPELLNQAAHIECVTGDASAP
jgi:hypothetical protein